MYNVVKIGERDVPMLAMASTDAMYKNVFHADPIKMQAGDMDAGESIELFMRMGFIMARYAELKDRKAVSQANEDDYLDWLDGFERADYFNALPDIRATYEGQAIGMAETKKNNDQPSEE